MDPFSSLTLKLQKLWRRSWYHKLWVIIPLILLGLVAIGLLGLLYSSVMRRIKLLQSKARDAKRMKLQLESEALVATSDHELEVIKSKIAEAEKTWQDAEAEVKELEDQHDHIAKRIEAISSFKELEEVIRYNEEEP